MGHPNLATRMRQLLADVEIHDDVVTRAARAPDASHVLLTPDVVVVPRSAQQVAAVMRASAALGADFTFRSGGTSLCGQAVTDGVLIDVRRHFRSVEILDGGAKVRLSPGSTLREVNTRLAPYSRRLGPDPASDIACTVGGVVANNSSGMACGTTENAYRTLESAVIVLPSGTVVDTAHPDADSRLRHDEPDLFEGLLRLRDRVRSNAESMRIIAAQYAMKNTMGYGVNSFVDHDRASDILRSLIVGSEGTLGFIASVVMNTVPLRPHAAAGLLLFSDLVSATRVLPELVESDASVIEVLDASSLRAAAIDPRVAEHLPKVGPESTTAALLVEYRADTAEEVEHLAELARPTLEELPLLHPVLLATDTAVRDRLWKARKGLFATVAAGRPPGTSAMFEDVVVPVPRLADTCLLLDRALLRHGYQGSVIFGHAKDGNIHFMLTDRFEDDRLDALGAFTEDLVDLILEAGGSLKAEHGTGRVMAPYLRRQFGDELYAVMREVKRLFDPHGLLSRGVLIAQQESAHLTDVKKPAPVDASVDACVECGFCEPICPSKDITLTPRQRIVLRRAESAARAAGDVAYADAIVAGQDLPVIDSCAVDSMCATSCPLGIDTGQMVKHMRAERHGALAQAAGAAGARHWGSVVRGASATLSVASAMPPRATESISGWMADRFRPGAVPRWSTDLPPGGARTRLDDRQTPNPVAFLPTCMNSLYAAAPGSAAAFQALCRRAGIEIWTPPDWSGLCCGTPWSSKGLTAGYDEMRARVTEAATGWRAAGAVVAIADASTCSKGLAAMLTDVDVPIQDCVSFAATEILPRLERHHPLTSLFLHPTCGSHHNGSLGHLAQIAAWIADEVVVSPDWSCCGFAGDRGMLLPALTASATAREAHDARSRTFDAYVSDNRGCQMGLSRASGRSFRHILEVLDDVSRS